MRTCNGIDVVKRYIDGVKAVLDALPIDEIEDIAEILYQAYKANKKIILMGNGGSAATASHFACDLAKGCAISGKRRFRSFALSDSISMVTAYANDLGYEEIFAEQLKNIVEKGDIVIGISASGNSKNILKAMELANKRSAVSIGLTGFKGGKIKGSVYKCLIVPSDSMEQIEDTHLMILHALKILLISRLRVNQRKRSRDGQRTL